MTSGRRARCCASNYDRHIGDIGLTVKASAVERESGRGRDALVDVKIDPSRVSFTETGDRHVGALNISVFCGDAREKVVGELWNTMDLALTQETYDCFMRDGIPYTARVPLTGELRYVKVIVYDYAADLLGSVITRVR